MLQRLVVKGFRCLRDVTIELPDPALVVLIGPNGAGKSSVLEVLDLLASAAQGNLQEALYGRRGGGSLIQWSGQDALALHFEMRFLPVPGSPFERDGGPVEYVLRLEPRGDALAVTREQVRVYKRGLNARPLIVAHRDEYESWLLNVQTRERDEDVSEEERDPARPRSPSSLLLAEVRQPERYPTLLHIQEAIRSMVVYTAFNTSPTWARGHVEQDVNPRTPVYAQPVARLDSRGIQLINALKTLHDADDERPWRELERDFRAEFPFCSSLKFPTSESGGRLGLKWTDARSGRTLLADHLSDGMLAYLQLLAALHAPDRPAALGFDEPESHLHPSLLRRVVARMEARSAVTPLFIATHSDSLLDFLEEPAKTVYILEFKDQAGTRIQKLEPKALEQWREEYRLSELRSRGLLDHGSQQWAEDA